MFVREERLVIGELRVFPREPESHEIYESTAGRKPGSWSADLLGDRAPVPVGGLTARKTQEAPFSDALVRARDMLLVVAADPDAQRDHVLADHRLDPTQLQQVERGGRAGRRRANDDRRLAKLASDYVALALSDRRPVETLASRHHITRGHAKRLLAEARKRGLLERAPELGTRAGGTLTDKARALLERGEEA
jgi:hypothetical protein